MRTTAIKCVVFVVLTFLLSLSRGDVADAEVSCVFMESCILPCSFQAADGLVLHWNQVTAGNTPVHSYYHNQDQLTHQGQRFRGRTSLFKDQISRGNASLQLTRVEVQDQGRYQCYTSTNKVFEAFINLKVDALVRKVDIQQVGNRITCSSEGIYPEPELTWSTSPPSNETFRNTTTVQKTEQQLYNISSSLILSHSLTDLDFSCTISTRRNWRRETLSKPNPPDVEEQTNAGTVVGPVVGGILGLAVIGGLAALCIYKRIKNRSTRRPSGTAASELQELDSLTNGTENGGGRNDPEPEEETNFLTGN